MGKNTIHRDLAARNCLLHLDLENRLTLKIADFGLSKCMESHYEKYDVYKMTNDTRLPVKWLAPEVLRHRLFTTYSDVWAFGILIWEMLTRCMCMPYGTLNAWNELLVHLDSGGRLSKPAHCDDELYKTLIKCWEPE